MLGLRGLGPEGVELEGAPHADVGQGDAVAHEERAQGQVGVQQAEGGVEGLLVGDLLRQTHQRQLEPLVHL